MNARKIKTSNLLKVGEIETLIAKISAQIQKTPATEVEKINQLRFNQFGWELELLMLQNEHSPESMGDHLLTKVEGLLCLKENPDFLMPKAFLEYMMYSNPDNFQITHTQSRKPKLYEYYMNNLTKLACSLYNIAMEMFDAYEDVEGTKGEKEKFEIFNSLSSHFSALEQMHRLLMKLEEIECGKVSQEKEEELNNVMNWFFYCELRKFELRQLHPTNQMISQAENPIYKILYAVQVINKSFFVKNLSSEEEKNFYLKMFSILLDYVHEYYNNYLGVVLALAEIISEMKDAESDDIGKMLKNKIEYYRSIIKEKSQHRKRSFEDDNEGNQPVLKSAPKSKKTKSIFISDESEKATKTADSIALNTPSIGENNLFTSHDKLSKNVETSIRPERRRVNAHV